MKIEHKLIGGHITSVKQEDRNGVQIGVVQGLLAAWTLDRGDFFGTKDRFVRGAFVSSILEHIQRRRQVRMLYQHGTLIGGFPMEFLKETDEGLFAVGEINLNVQEGAEAYALAKQGVLSDFSVGFSVDEFTMDGDIRTITKATLWEASLVQEPMNPDAVVQQVKSVVPFQNFPLAASGSGWEASAALGRVKEFTDSEDVPGEAYKKFFVWYDKDDAKNFDAYKLPIVDIVKGVPTVIPEALFAAAECVKDAEVAVGAEDIAHIEQYYKKMGLGSPFDDDEDKQFYGIDDVKEWTERDIEKAMRAGARFSKSATRMLMGIMGKEIEAAGDDVEKYGKILDELKGIKESWKARE